MTSRDSLSFGARAEDYERVRPDYPVDAVAWLIGDACRVADVGAGTGTLTRVIAALGRTVTAVEPDDRMRAALSEALPGVPALGGTGEHVPLPDASVDAVTYGQAWHWVDDLVTLTLSRSYVITASANERRTIVDGVRHLAEERCRQTGRDEVTMPYRTVAWRLTR